jgi:hypothetical protein
MKTTKLALIAAATATATVGLPATAHGVPTPPCSNGQVVVTAGQYSTGMGHRGLELIFSLASGVQPCTLTGYPGVDSGAGGPLVHAKRTLSGYMGGVRTETAPTITVTASQPAHAVVEGVAVDANDVYRLCPTYTDMRVTPPDTTDTVTVPTRMDTCELWVHPVGSDI